MSTEIINFLTTKFTTALFEEVLKGGMHEFPLMKIFQDISLVLQKKVSQFKPIHTSDHTLSTCLYTLNDSITECRLLSESRRKRALASYTPKEWYKLQKIKGQLLKTMKDLQSVTDAGLSTSATTVEGTTIHQQVTGLLERSRVYGFDEKMEDIVTSLRKKGESGSGINTIGIVGMGGSGKTTLCQLVYNHQIVKREFIPRIWVSLSNTLFKNWTDFTRSIVEYILKEIGAGEIEEKQDDDDDDNNESRLEENEDGTNSPSLHELLVTLHKHLSGKKYLIIFDNVWDLNGWYEMLLNSQISTLNETEEPRGLPEGYGGAIIITSRLEEDVKEMIGEANLHRSPTLDQDDSWSIFLDVMHEDGVHRDGLNSKWDHKMITSMKNEIVENCNGLPFAAKTLGQAFLDTFQQGMALKDPLFHYVKVPHSRN